MYGIRAMTGRGPPEEQIREGLLIDHGVEGVSPNQDDPKVARAVAAARELHDWVPSDEYREAFKAERDVAWAPGTRKLWTKLNLL